MLSATANEWHNPGHSSRVSYRLDAVTRPASAKSRSLSEADNQAKTRKRAIHSAAAQELARVGKHKRRYCTSDRDRFLAGFLDLA